MSKHKLELQDEIPLRRAMDSKDIRPDETPAQWIRRLQETADD